MAASLDDLLKLLNKWKTNGNVLGIQFEQSGQTNLAMLPDISSESFRASMVTVSVARASRRRVVFKFGTGLASGTLLIPLSTGVVFWEIIDPQNPPFFFQSCDLNAEACIKFTWLKQGDWCLVTGFPKTGT